MSITVHVNSGERFDPAKHHILPVEGVGVRIVESKTGLIAATVAGCSPAFAAWICSMIGPDSSYQVEHQAATKELQKIDELLEELAFRISQRLEKAVEA